MKVYLDNVIDSASVRSDLRDPTEMAAVKAILEYAGRGHIEVVTSRESWREQERTKDPAVRQQLLEARPGVPVVPYDHEIFGFSLMHDRYGGFITNPSVTDIIDQPLFDDLKAHGLKDEADAKHLMYAVRNVADRFVTLDADFLKNRHGLEARCGGLRIVTPSELLAELKSTIGQVAS